MIRWLSMSSACDYAGISRNTMKKLIEDGCIDGKSLIEIQGLLGHSHINATQIYSHLTDDHLADISGVELGPVDLGD